MLQGLRLNITIICMLSLIGCQWMHSLFAGVPSREAMLKVLQDKILNENNPLVQISTSEGDMIFELYADWAPRTVDNFISLVEGKKEFIDPVTGQKVKRRYYKDLTFHRVIPNFVIQGGDIRGDGSGGPGYAFKDEISAKALGLDTIKVKNSSMYAQDIQNLVIKEFKITSQEQFNAKNSQIRRRLEQMQNMSVEEVLIQLGYEFEDSLKSVPATRFTLAMANAGPNTNGSQFFINLNNNPHLNGKAHGIWQTAQRRKSHSKNCCCF